MCPIERILRSYPSSGTSCRLSAVEKAYFAVLSALGGCVDDHCKVGSLQGCAADQAAVHILFAQQDVASLSDSDTYLSNKLTIIKQKKK